MGTAGVSSHLVPPSYSDDCRHSVSVPANGRVNDIFFQTKIVPLINAEEQNMEVQGWLIKAFSSSNKTTFSKVTKPCHFIKYL